MSGAAIKLLDFERIAVFPSKLHITSDTLKRGVQQFQAASIILFFLPFCCSFSENSLKTGNFEIFCSLIAQVIYGSLLWIVCVHIFIILPLHVQCIASMLQSINYYLAGSSMWSVSAFRLRVEDPMWFFFWSTSSLFFSAVHILCSEKCVHTCLFGMTKCTTHNRLCASKNATTRKYFRNCCHRSWWFMSHTCFAFVSHSIFKVIIVEFSLEKKKKKKKGNKTNGTYPLQWDA